MDHFFHKKTFTTFQTVLLAAVCVVVMAAVLSFSAVERAPLPSEPDGRSWEQIYQEAVVDAMVAEEDEVFPLVTITEDSDKVSWKDGRILLLTLHSNPEIYAKEEAEAPADGVWTFTDREIQEWYQNHKDGVTDWDLRLFQLIGVPPDAGYTHATAMWVEPKDVLRPAYRTDIQDQTMTTSMAQDMPEEYREWFDGNILWSYFDSAYPWTRLGYTYDWNPESGEYGMTEFLVRPGAEVRIEYTDSIDGFVKRLEQGLS